MGDSYIFLVALACAVCFAAGYGAGIVIEHVIEWLRDGR